MGYFASHYFYGPTAAPTPAPDGRVTEIASTSFDVTIDSVSGQANTNVHLQTRPLGSFVAWTTQDTTAAPAAGVVLTASGLTTGDEIEARLVEVDAGGNVADGTHFAPIVPSESIWSTLTALVAAALEGQSLAAESIFIGVQPPPQYADVVAVIRTTRERRMLSANRVERMLFPVHVEFRIRGPDDQGDTVKTLIETWQRRIEAALHEKHADDFPGVAGLEEVTVDIMSKDDREVGNGADEDELVEELVGRANVNFVIWRDK